MRKEKGKKTFLFVLCPIHKDWLKEKGKGNEEAGMDQKSFFVIAYFQFFFFFPFSIITLSESQKSEAISEGSFHF